MTSGTPRPRPSLYNLQRLAVLHGDEGIRPAPPAAETCHARTCTPPPPKHPRGRTAGPRDRHRTRGHDPPRRSAPTAGVRRALGGAGHRDRCRRRGRGIRGARTMAHSEQRGSVAGSLRTNWPAIREHAIERMREAPLGRIIAYLTDADDLARAWTPALRASANSKSLHASQWDDLVGRYRQDRPRGRAPGGGAAHRRPPHRGEHPRLPGAVRRMTKTTRRGPRRRTPRDRRQLPR